MVALSAVPIVGSLFLFHYSRLTPFTHIAIVTVHRWMVQGGSMGSVIIRTALADRALARRCAAISAGRDANPRQAVRRLVARYVVAGDRAGAAHAALSLAATYESFGELGHAMETLDAALVEIPDAHDVAERLAALRADALRPFRLSLVR